MTSNLAPKKSRIQQTFGAVAVCINLILLAEGAYLTQNCTTSPTASSEIQGNERNISNSLFSFVSLDWRKIQKFGDYPIVRLRIKMIDSDNGVRCLYRWDASQASYQVSSQSASWLLRNEGDPYPPTFVARSSRPSTTKCPPCVPSGHFSRTQDHQLSL